MMFPPVVNWNSIKRVDGALFCAKALLNKQYGKSEATKMD